MITPASTASCSVPFMPNLPKVRARSERRLQRSTFVFEDQVARRGFSGDGRCIAKGYADVGLEGK